jgi:hypothetical protein
MGMSDALANRRSAPIHQAAIEFRQEGMAERASLESIHQHRRQVLRDF